MIRNPGITSNSSSSSPGKVIQEHFPWRGEDRKLLLKCD
jgi:hypothetical protein